MNGSERKLIAVMPDTAISLILFRGGCLYFLHRLVTTHAIHKFSFLLLWIRINYILFLNDAFDICPRNFLLISQETLKENGSSGKLNCISSNLIYHKIATLGDRNLVFIAIYNIKMIWQPGSVLTLVSFQKWLIFNDV